MSLIIIGKVALASLGAGSVALGGFLLHKLLNPATVEIYGFVDVSDAAATATVSALPNTLTILECKIKDKENKFDCEVDVIDTLTAEEDRHVEWGKLSGWKPATSTLETKKFYKIKTSSSEFEKTKPLIIEVFKKEGSQDKLGNVNPLFIAEKNKIIKGKTNLFVGQASKELQTTTGYQCSWTTPATTAILKSCSIFPFVYRDADSVQEETTDDFSALKFTKTTDAISPIKAHHFYLIKFADADSKDIESFTTSSLIYTKDVGSNAGTEITFRKIAMASDVEDQLLILKQN